MVEITNANEIIQLRKIKSRNTNKNATWNHSCNCCHRGFKAGETKIQWRLRIPFRRRHSQWDTGLIYGWSAMFWTTHCKSCFQLTAKAWEKALPTVRDFAKS